MHHAVYVGFGLAALFGLVGPAVARRVHPALGTWLLSVGGAVAACSAAVGLVLLSAALVGQNPEVAEAGHWSVSALRHSDPVRWPVAAVSLITLCWSLMRVAAAAIRRSRSLRAARRTVGALTAAGDLVVVADGAPDAFAVPGRPGKVFMTTSMLAVLDRQERDSLLAHERSHLRHHHHRHRTVVQLAVALNPLLWPLIEAQLWATERWADEDATTATSRGVTANALARAAAATSSLRRRPEGVLAVADAAVGGRIAALLSEPPRRRPWLIVATVLLLAVAAVATAEATRDSAVIFHAAGYIHRHIAGVRVHHPAAP